MVKKDTWCEKVKDNSILDGHDIALLELSEDVTLSDVVWPACLPGCYSNIEEIITCIFVADPITDLFLTEVGDDVSVVGFGMINVTTKEKADILQIANIQVGPKNQC